jgi:heat shock protein HslJ
VLGKMWEWVAFEAPTDRLAIEKPELYTLQFDRDGFVFIRADCNRGQANYFQPAVGQLAIHGISLTKVACPAGSHSTRFVQYLELARTWAMEDGSLVLEQPGTQGTLRFRRRP